MNFSPVVVVAEKRGAGSFFVGADGETEGAAEQDGTQRDAEEDGSHAQKRNVAKIANQRSGDKGWGLGHRNGRH